MTKIQGLNSTVLAREPTSPLVAISILNWNGWQDTLECLESVRKLNYPNYLAVVVDNGSSNASAERIKAWAKENLGPGHVLADYRCEIALNGGDPQTEQALEHAPSPAARLVLIRNEENLGFAGGNNVSIGYALTRPVPVDFFMFLNNDAIIHQDCLTELVSVGLRTQSGVTGATVLNGSGEPSKYPGVIPLAIALIFPFMFHRVPYPDTPEDVFEMSYANGAAMIISEAALRRLFASRAEYLNSSLFMYNEDLELQYQTKKMGYRALVCRKAIVRHKGGASSPGLEGELRAYYYLERNRILVANCVFSLPLRVLFHLVNIPLLGVRVVKQVLQHRRSLARIILSGQFDGYRGVAGKWKHHDENNRAPISVARGQ